MIHTTLSTSAARYILGDVDALLCGASKPMRLVTGVALAVLSGLDTSYQLLVGSLKLTYTAMALPAALWCALFSYEERLYDLFGVLRSVAGHLGNTASFAATTLLSPLVCAGYIHYSTLIGVPHSQDMINYLARLGAGFATLADEIAYIQSLELSAEKVARFRALIQTQNRLENVLGDGNCGLRAIVRSLQSGITLEEENDQIAILRAEMIHYLREHRHEYRHFMEGVNVEQEGLLDRAFDYYLERMAQSRIYIGNLELQAISRVLNCNIHVFSCDSPCLNAEGELMPSEMQIFGSGDPKQPTARLYYDPIGVHYQVLHRTSHSGNG